MRTKEISKVRARRKERAIKSERVHKRKEKQQESVRKKKGENVNFTNRFQQQSTCTFVNQGVKYTFLILGALPSNPRTPLHNLHRSNVYFLNFGSISF